MSSEAPILVAVLFAIGLAFCFGGSCGQMDGKKVGRLSGTLETLSAVSPCDGGYAVRHFDAGTFACVDTTWVEVKP